MSSWHEDTRQLYETDWEEGMVNKPKFCKRVATLVAAAQLSNHFFNEKHFAQAVLDLCAAYGRVPALYFIAGQKTF